MKEFNDQKDLENISGGEHWNYANPKRRDNGDFFLDQEGVMTLLSNGYTVSLIPGSALLTESISTSTWAANQNLYHIVDQNGNPISYASMQQILGNPQ